MNLWNKVGSGCLGTPDSTVNEDNGLDNTTTKTSTYQPHVGVLRSLHSSSREKTRGEWSLILPLYGSVSIDSSVSEVPNHSGREWRVSGTDGVTCPWDPTDFTLFGDGFDRIFTDNYNRRWWTQQLLKSRATLKQKEGPPKRKSVRVTRRKLERK